MPVTFVSRAKRQPPNRSQCPGFRQSRGNVKHIAVSALRRYSSSACSPAFQSLDRSFRRGQRVRYSSHRNGNSKRSLQCPWLNHQAAALETLEERLLAANGSAGQVIVVRPDAILQRIAKVEPGLDPDSIAAYSKCPGRGAIPLQRPSRRPGRALRLCRRHRSGAPFSFTLLRIEPTHSAPPGSTAASLQRTKGQPGRAKNGVGGASPSGFHSAMPEPRDKARVSVRLVSITQVTGFRKEPGLDGAILQR